MRIPAPSPVFFSEPLAPRCSRLTRTVRASLTMPWDVRPAMSHTKPKPQESCSKEDSYRVWSTIVAGPFAGLSGFGTIPIHGGGFDAGGVIVRLPFGNGVRMTAFRSPMGCDIRTRGLRKWRAPRIRPAAAGAVAGRSGRWAARDPPCRRCAKSRNRCTLGRSRRATGRPRWVGALGDPVRRRTCQPGEVRRVVGRLDGAPSCRSIRVRNRTDCTQTVRGRRGGRRLAGRSPGKVPIPDVTFRPARGAQQRGPTSPMRRADDEG